jgi:hypothetical protein
MVWPVDKYWAVRRRVSSRRIASASVVGKVGEWGGLVVGDVWPG